MYIQPCRVVASFDLRVQTGLMFDFGEFGMQ